MGGVADDWVRVSRESQWGDSRVSVERKVEEQLRQVGKGERRGR